MDERIPDSCYHCEKYIYKGEDEKYCQAARMREIWTRKGQRRPKWCPIERRIRNNENHAG